MAGTCLDNYKTVDHINGDKKDNFFTNLRWLSLRDNIKAYNELKRGRQ